MSRRKIHFENLSDAAAQCDQLLQSGYERNGNWSLAQICNHMRMTIDSSIDGYPKWMAIGKPLRPLLRWLMLPKLLRGDSPAGIKTASTFVPAEDLSDAEEVALFTESVRRFQTHTGYLHPHPGFGKFDHASLEQFHACHAAHHLGFLAARE
ncbi:DUF1569 domain-containing protein [Rosistilla oblonga]|uniref:DUF1569 domain-containing protein n=1 Tax=Rosistilla oblonga TaxID=2527990 RepID=A0A518IWE5_9BACT|nr:DUF1569 domain-containing protein [Rosistilla oblonga]QDV57409.1 hypothetical protein Mal33_34190 [Rosistilla oblonga]